MTIYFVTGNILESSAEALCNPVNCVGIMGKGLAKQFKDKFPNYFNWYQAKCANREIRPGYPEVYGMAKYGLMEDSLETLYIVSFPTKDHWSEKSNLKDIEEALIRLCHKVKERNIKSIALPRLGCGLGGLDWNVVKPVMTQVLLQHLPTEVEVYIYE